MAPSYHGTMSLRRSLLRVLGLDETARDPEVSSSIAVNGIVDRLDHLEPERARFVAAFAMVLARVARADLEVSGDESRAMASLVAEVTGLDPDQATLVAEMAAHRSELLGVAEDYIATRELAASTSTEERVRLLAGLFAVAAADDSVSLVEEEEIRQIASELGLEHRDYTAARATVRDKREVLRRLGNT